jgi:predicted RNA-binding Zn-ribbon protein involved in translation (DUF1610 family)
MNPNETHSRSGSHLPNDQEDNMNKRHIEGIEPLSTAQDQRSCSQCGAGIVFSPGTTRLTCPYCGTQNTIEHEPFEVKEFDLAAYIDHAAFNRDLITKKTVSCKGCGAKHELGEHKISGTCPFCGLGLVLDHPSESVVHQPQMLLPFKKDRKEAGRALKRWIGGRWFAPNALKKAPADTERFIGMYLPYWTYDAQTFSRYKGERGDDYTVRRNRTGPDGKRRSVMETKTRWSLVEGRVQRHFNDVLVCATRSLPGPMLQQLEPWPLEELVPYQKGYLRGFQTETYQVTLDDGLEVAKQRMAPYINEDIRRHIGGDHQRIQAVETTYADVTFKHVLMPVWVSAYRFRGKTYRFLVSAQTGEVQGERPWSILKIALALLSLAVAATVMAWLDLL